MGDSHQAVSSQPPLHPMLNLCLPAHLQEAFPQWTSSGEQEGTVGTTQSPPCPRFIVGETTVQTAEDLSAGLLVPSPGLFRPQLLPRPHSIQTMLAVPSP